MLLLLLLSHFSRVRLCDPIDGSPPGSPIPGILQARKLECVAKVKLLVPQSCPTLCDVQSHLANSTSFDPKVKPFLMHHTQTSKHANN